VHTAAGIVFDDPSAIQPTADFPLGTTLVQLAVDDGMTTVMDAVEVTVVDTAPKASGNRAERF